MTGVRVHARLEVLAVALLNIHILDYEARVDWYRLHEKYT
jgi:hypothetical protein